MDGIVCSPLEVAAVRQIAGPEAVLVTPGVRSAGSAKGDQKRVATPAEAVRDGADYLVIGRQITRAADPAAEASRVLEEIATCMGGAIHIGTSGWHYKHWKGPFYPEKLPNSKLLDYYSRHFDTVELNNTFYRLPPETGLRQLARLDPRRLPLRRQGQPLHHPHEEAEGPGDGDREVFRARRPAWEEARPDRVPDSAVVGGKSASGWRRSWTRCRPAIAMPSSCAIRPGTRPRSTASCGGGTPRSASSRSPGSTRRSRSRRTSRLFACTGSTAKSGQLVR